MNTIKMPYKPFGLLLFCFLQLSCSTQAITESFYSMQVSVCIPELPQIWKDADGWELSVIEASNSGTSKESFCQKVQAGDIIDIRLPRGKNAAILCRACFGRFRTKPYGAIWPFQMLENAQLELSKESGYLSFVVASFIKSGIWDFDFNYSKFLELLNSKSLDPWQVETKILDKISSKSFRASYFTEPETIEIELDALDFDLYPESPYGTMLHSGIKQSVKIPIDSTLVWQNSTCRLSVCYTQKEGLLYTILK